MKRFIKGASQTGSKAVLVSVALLISNSGCVAVSLLGADQVAQQQPQGVPRNSNDSARDDQPSRERQGQTRHAQGYELFAATEQAVERDANIAEAIRAKFLRDEFVPPDLGINVVDGQVTLSGNVADQATAKRAVLLCKHVPGVLNVESRLVVPR